MWSHTQVTWEMVCWVFCQWLQVPHSMGHCATTAWTFAIKLVPSIVPRRGLIPAPSQSSVRFPTDAGTDRAVCHRRDRFYLDCWCRREKNTNLFEPFDLLIWFLAWMSTLTLARLGLQVKVVGQRSRSSCDKNCVSENNLSHNGIITWP